MALDEELDSELDEGSDAGLDEGTDEADFTVMSCVVKARSIEDANLDTNGFTTEGLVERFNISKEVAERVIMVMEGPECIADLNKDPNCNAEDYEKEIDSSITVQGVILVTTGSIKYLIPKFESMTLKRSTGACGTYPPQQSVLFRKNGPSAIPAPAPADIGEGHRSLISIQTGAYDEIPIIKVYAEKKGAIVSTNTYSAAPMQAGEIAEFAITSLQEVSIRYNDGREDFDEGETENVVGVPSRASDMPASCSFTAAPDIGGGASLLALLIAGRIAGVFNRTL